MRSTLRAFAAWFILLGAAPMLAQATDYEIVMSLPDTSSRVGAFNLLSPEGKVSVVREQITRWTNANRGRLTQQQVAVLQELAAAFSAEDYERPMSDATRKRLDAMQAKAASVLSRQDIGAAMTVNGPYLTPQP